MPDPVISVEAMRSWETASWEQGVDRTGVIDQVGCAIADWLRPQLKGKPPALILAGKGHNGDDGRAAATHLGSDQTRLLEVWDPEESVAELEAHLSATPTAIVDCLFGIGLNRPLNPSWSRFIQIINESGTGPVVSIDVPSGLDAETGETMGAAVEADFTLTIGAPKRGLLTHNALKYTGYLRVLSNIGLMPMVHKSDLYFSSETDFRSQAFRKRPSDHKRTNGHLWLLAGSAGYHGAAVLATRSALRAQTGLVTLVTMPETYSPVAAQLQQAMVRPWPPSPPALASATAILIGPGLADPELPNPVVTQTINVWKRSPLPVIVDASALAWIPPSRTPFSSIRIITPHPGEAARLLGCQARDIEHDRIAALRKLSRTFGQCWVVLKGTHTLVGRSQGPVYVNATGNPGLAQGGSGDVLAGFAAGLIAQPRLQPDVLLTLRRAVWQHGAAADQLADQRSNWIIEDLPEALFV